MYRSVPVLQLAICSSFRSNVQGDVTAQLFLQMAPLGAFPVCSPALDIPSNQKLLRDPWETETFGIGRYSIVDGLLLKICSQLCLVAWEMLKKIELSSCPWPGAGWSSSVGVSEAHLEAASWTPSGSFGKIWPQTQALTALPETSVDSSAEEVNDIASCCFVIWQQLW